MFSFRASTYGPKNSVAAFTYRPDVDGLRAIAILAVLFYHAELPGVPGGFVGVDIFFVISGFLIASLIQKDVLLGQFSLAGFWMRRAKRIFPALAVVLVATTLASAVILIPDDLKTYGKSLLAAAFFFSNMHFSGSNGYFDAPSLEKPLLHTWSLSIEEQFYILFPVIFVVILRRFTVGTTVAVMAAIVAGGACLAEAFVQLYPDQAFYLLPARIWELGLGALLAVAAPAVALRGRTALALSLLGAALLAFAITQGDWQRSFPGLVALVPCLGAALLILSGTRPGPIQRLLSWPPFVFLGLISYSLYLWHWPLLSLPRYLYGRQLDGWETAAALTASVLLATLTWRFIEQPARASRIGLHHPLRAIGIAAIPLVVLAAAGTALRVDEGLPWRMPAEFTDTYRVASKLHPLQNQCRDAEGARDDAFCNFGAKPLGASFDMVIFGDSHAEALAPAFWDLAKQWGWSGRQISTGGCIALFDVVVWDRGVQPRCLEFSRRFEQFLQNNKDLKLVVLASRWSRFGITAPELHPVQKSNVDLLHAADPTLSPFDTRKVLGEALARTVKRLTDAGIKVVVAGQAPEYFGNPLNCWMRQKRWGDYFQPCEQATSELLGYIAPSHRLIAAAVADNRMAKAVYLTDHICDARNCGIEFNGVPLYRDRDHMSTIGAKQLAGFMSRELGGFLGLAADASIARGLTEGQPASSN